MIESDKSLPGWIGRASRLEAEGRLDRQPVGTFILRQGDELDDRIARALARENHERVESCVLTFVEPHEKISEKLIVHVPEGWTFYEDNPDLHDPEYHFYPTMRELLESVESVARRPLSF